MVILREEEEEDDELNRTGPNEAHPRDEENALFFGEETVDDGTEQASPESSDLAALQAIKSESTAAEEAEALKEQANNQMRARTKFHTKQAVELYTKALSIEDTSHGIQALLYNNRSQAHLRLENDGNALDDARWAIKVNGEKNEQTAKASFRGCKAAMRLEKYDTCIELANVGIESEPTNQQLKLFREKASSRKPATQPSGSHNGRGDASSLNGNNKALNENDALEVVQRIERRNLKYTFPMYSIEEDVRPFVGDDGLLHHRVLMLYPKCNHSDLVDDASECDSVSEILSISISDVPMEWDKEREHKRSNVRAYIEKNAARASVMDRATLKDWLQGKDVAVPTAKRGGKAREFIDATKDDLPLGRVIARNGHLVPGCVTLYIIPGSDSNFKDWFLAGNDETA